MYRILIADIVPSLNKGEMTILEGMLESFKPLGEVEVAMLSDMAEIDAPRYGTKVKIVDLRDSLRVFGQLRGLSRLFASILFLFQHLLFICLHKVLRLKALKLMRSEIWRQYVQSDVIILGHDGTFNTLIPLPFYNLYSTLLAKSLGKPIVFYGGSISQSRELPWFLRKGARFALRKMDLISNQMDLITLRENVTYRYMKDIGVRNERLFVTADPAFLLQPASAERTREIMVAEGLDRARRPLIGITANRATASQAFPDLGDHDSGYQKHNQLLAGVIDHLTSSLDASVVFVPHCIGFGEEDDDRIVAKDVLLKCRNKDRVKVIDNEYSAAELKGLIGQFDLFIGERIHSVINAMTMCVPSIALTHSGDQRLDMIRMLGQENAIHHIENLAGDSLASKANQVWLQRDEIRKALRDQTRVVQERAMLNGSLLKEVLTTKREGSGR